MDPRPKALALATLLAAAVGACAPGGASSTAPRPAQRADSTPVAAAEAPRNWQLLDDSTDRVLGVSAERAVRELLAGRTPARTVVVAVIDGGVDTAHVDLRDNLWRNADEIPGNDVDDDRNGYVDDVYGWNFIGGADGRNVDFDTFEVTRLYAACTANPAAQDAMAAAERARCAEIGAAYQEKRADAERTLVQVRRLESMHDQIEPVLEKAIGVDSLTAERVRAFRTTRPDVAQARDLYLRLHASDLSRESLAEAKKAYEGQVRYGYNLTFDPRPIVGDDYRDGTDRRYGNPDVTGPDAKHGTHVAGIIAAVRGNDLGIDGIAPAVRVMAVRAVPNGDERDKDVANAIRYAVDNGAHIINMSFGKAYSPNKPLVDEAVRYAQNRGVLLVHAAGNDGADLAKSPSFPTPILADSTRPANWLEVGASAWGSRDSLAAPFSNYGAEQVDLFAPGVDILSTVPGSEYDRESGTSMAAPVTTGVAALLMAYFPELSPAEVRTILMESTTKLGERRVALPGGDPGQTVAFGTLSRTGGVVNAYRAVQLAEATVQAKKAAQ